MTKFEKVRQEQFPITERLAYLDTSSSGLICKNAKDAMVKYINDRYENAFGIANVTGAWAHADAMRAMVAQMFNAEPEEKSRRVSPMGALNYLITFLEMTIFCTSDVPS